MSEKASNKKRSVGEYSAARAFSIVRDLEHAGIHAEATGSSGTYEVLVHAGDYERALCRI